jgi:hypothetical protein
VTKKSVEAIVAAIEEDEAFDAAVESVGKQSDEEISRELVDAGVDIQRMKMNILAHAPPAPGAGLWKAAPWVVAAAIVAAVIAYALSRREPPPPKPAPPPPVTAKPAESEPPPQQYGAGHPDEDE